LEPLNIQLNGGIHIYTYTFSVYILGGIHKVATPTHIVCIDEYTHIESYARQNQPHKQLIYLIILIDT